MGRSLSNSFIPCWDLTDVTLADEDTNSILTDNANRAIQGNEAMQVGQLVAKFATEASGTTRWTNLQSLQVSSRGGQYLKTMDKASYGKIVFLQMAGGAI